MNTLIKILLLLVLVAIVGIGVFLATWDMPPPSAPVERTIPDERFSR
ncbi:hypothetical protein [Indioceanicola profundi]|nr:hypothetical protein [Indioceanicola profundi]